MQPGHWIAGYGSRAKQKQTAWHWLRYKRLSTYPSGLLPHANYHINDTQAQDTGNGRTHAHTLDTQDKPGHGTLADKWQAVMGWWGARRELWANQWTNPSRPSPTHTLLTRRWWCRHLAVRPSAALAPLAPATSSPCHRPGQCPGQIACTILNGFWLFMTIRRADWPARCWPLIIRHLNDDDHLKAPCPETSVSCPLLLMAAAQCNLWN